MGSLTHRSTDYIGSSIGNIAGAEAQRELNRKREYRQTLAEKALQIMNVVARPEAVSTTALIAKMGIPRDVFKHLYAGLDDFQDDMIESGWKDLLRELRLVATTTSGREGLDAIILTYRNYVKENKGSYYVSVCQGRDASVGRKYASRLCRLLHIVLASCDLGHADLHRSAENLAEVLHGLAVMEITGETYGEVDTTITHIIRVYLNDLFNRYTP
ncbi:MAG: hypothetical protein AB8G95_14935 [Anaerolineae bacterium]